MAETFEIFVGDFKFVGTKKLGKALRFTVAWRIHSNEHGILGHLTTGNLIVRRGMGLTFLPQSEYTSFKRCSRWTLDYADLIIKTVSQAPLGKVNKYVDFIGSRSSEPWTPTAMHLMIEPKVEFTDDDAKGLWINSKGEILKGEEFFK